MFEQLTGRLEEVFRRLKGRGVLTVENIREALREVRRGLLEADVHFSVAKEIIRRVEERAIGQEVKLLVFSGGKFREAQVTLRPAP